MDITSQLIAFANQVQVMLQMARGRNDGGIDNTISFIQQQIRIWNGTQAIIDNLQAQLNALQGQATPVSVIPATLPDGQVSAAYNTQIGATGGTGSYTSFAVTKGNLPAGISLDPVAGSLFGVPTKASAATFTISVTDTGGNVGSLQYTLTIDPAPAAIVVTPASLPAGNVGVAYSQQLGATGGSGTYTNFAVTAGNPPAGITLSSTGLLSGTPTKAGTAKFTVTATDSKGAVGSTAYSLVTS